MSNIDAMRKRLEELEARFQSYDGGDRPQSPPMDLLRETLELKAQLVRAEIESCEACGGYLSANGECDAGKHDERI